MLGCLGGLIIIFGGMFLISTFVTWAFAEHRTAGKYRQLEMMQKYTPTPRIESAHPEWTITYKEGRGIKSVRVTADTEQEALHAALVLGINPRGILSTKKI
jgi:hypothetical protein